MSFGVVELVVGLTGNTWYAGVPTVVTVSAGSCTVTVYVSGVPRFASFNRIRAPVDDGAGTAVVGIGNRIFTWPLREVNAKDVPVFFPVSVISDDDEIFDASR